MPRAVFLDRDGVINTCTVKGSTPYPPNGVDELCVEPGAAEAMAKLKAAGYLLLVVTNQPDVARGTQTKAGVEAINEALRGQLPIDDVAVCYHDNADNCDCRKPKPGMLTTLAKKWHVDLHHSFMVGDRSGDIHAGESAGVRTFLVDRPYSKVDTCRPDFCVRDLAHASDIILQMVRIEPPRMP
ncbi:MAG TPA: HAD family hydrolase [Tepidisphaeraceae bacterium]|jgi:D-glycero-D-manno-heptose 1,7-bisphosphate phosphatase|nr:HAD family hydrolase [Tepidisphaeraceae bacterium]